MTTALHVEGMTCDHCRRAVKEALESVPGVSHAEVDLASGAATVAHEPDLDRQALLAAVEEEGYSAKVA
ncbi:MAG TPA: cation transporter [Fimbriimonadaceae bacterium]|nr:cation transporter [Fimbriimonadaceae bacterium]